MNSMNKIKPMVFCLISLIIIIICVTFAYNQFIMRNIKVTYHGVIVNTKTWELEDTADITLKGEQKRELFDTPQSATFEGRVSIQTKKSEDFNISYKDCSNYLVTFEPGFPKEIKSGDLVHVEYKEGDVQFHHIGILRSSNFSYDKISLAFEEEKSDGSINETSHVLIAPANDINEAKKLYQLYFDRSKSSSK